MMTFLPVMFITAVATAGIVLWGLALEIDDDNR